MLKQAGKRPIDLSHPLPTEAEPSSYHLRYPVCR
jgi:hypothetical protein